MEQVVDLVFPLRVNGKLPADHGYALYAGLSRLMEGLHDAEDVGVFPIMRSGIGGPGRPPVSPRSRLRLRLNSTRIGAAVALAGKQLTVDSHRVRLGVPRVLPLRPAASLRSGLVLIKLAHTSGNGVTPPLFLDATRRQLDALEIAATPAIPVHEASPQAGQPIRRVRRIKGRTIVGYPLVVEGLTAEESHRLQQEGLGGKRKMGCGLFLPSRAGSSKK